MNAFDRVMAAVLGLLAMALTGWAALVVLFQSLGWLKHALWQPVPGLMVLITADQQDRLYRVFQGFPNALDIVPGLGDGRAPSLFGDHLKGGEMVFWWFIELPFAVHLLIAAGLALWASEKFSSKE